MAEYVLLDTSAFLEFIEKKDSILTKYHSLEQEYDSIIDTLLENWEGQGAIAFRGDSNKVRKNIASLGDVLDTMCETLQGCLDIFDECDEALGRINRESSVNL